ncbi:MAG: hypothetical protein RMA76_09500 [Deltaproteobacteria bacterium]|jgi:hypothetical protein
MNHSTRIAALAVPLALLVASAAEAQSDGNPATSDVLTSGLVVPYDGFLMLDNTPMTGSFNLRFELWDHPTQTGTNRLVWSENQSVTFFNGRFSVGLGAGTQVSARSMREVVADGEKLYLAIQVEDGSGTLVPLSGRQAIEPVPYAAWSASAADFDVGGDLTVGGRLTAGAPGVQVVLNDGAVSASGQIQASSLTTSGQVQAGSVTTAGQVQAGSMSAGGQLQAGSLSVTGGVAVGQTVVAQGSITTLGAMTVGANDFRLGTNAHANGNGGRAMVAAASDTLAINFGNDFSGGTRVDGNLTYGGVFRGWSVTAGMGQYTDGSRSLGVTTSEGVCFLTLFSTDHNERDPSPMACHVYVDGTTWRLGNSEAGGNRGNVDCEARCLVF